MLLTLGITVPAMAQAQQKQEQQELVDSTVKDALEAFSDTTMEAVDSAVSRNINIVDDWDDDEDAGPIFKKFMREVNANGLVGMFFAMMVVLVIFVISPLVIFGLLLYFIFRNRRQKMRLAEMAMQNGQPIPDQLLREPDFGDTATYQSGMRQLFLGIGLMIFLGFTAG
jgi:ABC-type multidrug transport system fused ATPase/permease subunit